MTSSHENLTKNPPLSERLIALADQLKREKTPVTGDGSPVKLEALLPAEPVSGEVAVACWVADDGGQFFDLVDLNSGELIQNQTKLREALALLGMTETIEELASFELLPEIIEEFERWVSESDPDTELKALVERALRDTRALLALAPEEARIATTKILDDIGAALRALEKSWELLEDAADKWSEQQMKRASDSEREAVIKRVHALWGVMGIARRGPLLRPASAAVHQGREAGVAMATAITEARIEMVKSKGK